MASRICSMGAIVVADRAADFVPRRRIAVQRLDLPRPARSRRMDDGTGGGTGQNHVLSKGRTPWMPS